MVPDPPVLFYDASCGLCSRAVLWSLAHDRRGVLRFAPLGGAAWSATAVPPGAAGLDTVALLEEGRLRVRADAALRVLAIAGGGWALLARLGALVPRSLRDAAYRFVARRRRAWFGTSAGCRLPTPAERARFLP